MGAKEGGEWQGEKTCPQLRIHQTPKHASGQIRVPRVFVCPFL